MFEKFKIGDKVLINGVFDNNTSCDGKIGVVIGGYDSIGNKKYYDIEFEEEFHGGHAGSCGDGNEGRCWTYEVKFLEPVNQFVVELI